MKLVDENITHVYIVGSRLWGTHSHSSDFDLLVVADRLPNGTPKSQHRNQYDITLLAENEFIGHVQQGSLIESVCCLMDDKEACVLRRAQACSHLVDVTAMETWVSKRHAVDREKAKKFWLKGKPEEAYKILQHMITAEATIAGLRVKGKHTSESHKFTLEMSDLQELVQKGKNEDDRAWMEFEWPEVEALHSIRLNNIRR